MTGFAYLEIFETWRPLIYDDLPQAQALYVLFAWLIESSTTFTINIAAYRMKISIQIPSYRFD